MGWEEKQLKIFLPLGIPLNLLPNQPCRLKTAGRGYITCSPHVLCWLRGKEGMTVSIYGLGTTERYLV
jgi:hypothetical protein